jgi:hypothetical protein
MKKNREQIQENSPIKIQSLHFKMLRLFKTIIIIVFICYPVSIDLSTGLLFAEQTSSLKPYEDQILIERILSGSKGGQAYRLTYHVPVPIDVYWRFKTDFDNNFLKDNKFIHSHRFISRENNSVITENEYTSKPKVLFRWKTTFFYQNFRLDFVLLNPETTGHDFHYGHILLNPQGNTTQVVQEAHFKFFGASFWAVYPWPGGMTEFLKYTARWEHDMVLKLYDQYAR